MEHLQGHGVRPEQWCLPWQGAGGHEVTRKNVEGEVGFELCFLFCFLFVCLL